MSRHATSTSSHRRRSLQQRHRLARRAQLQIESLESRQLMAYDTTVLADNPIAYYRFEDATAGVAANVGSAGSAADGAVLGGVSVTVGATPALGNAYSFDGASGRVQLPDVAAFDMGTGPATIELWFSTTQTVRGDVLTYKGTGGDFGIHWRSNGVDRVSGYHGGFTAESNTGVGAGQWHHLVYTRSGTGINETVMYLDGRAVSKATSGQTFNILNDILIGANHSGDPSTGAGTFFNGLIDEVAIYNTALTEAQVQRHYDAGLGSYAGAVLETNPGVYYRFDDAPGSTTVQDASSNNRDGAVTGGVVFGQRASSVNGQESAGAFVVSGNDLLTGLSAVVTGGTLPGNDGTSTNSATLTNGQFGVPDDINAAENVAISNNLTLTFTLDTTNTPQGFDISSVAAYTGWQDGGRVDQDYTLRYATVDNPNVFFDLANVNYDSGNNSTQAVVSAASGILASRVAKIQFGFVGQENNYVGYRELDVFGVPSPATGAVNRGADFNGSNGYITGPTASELGMTNGSWTASAWIRPEALNGDRSIFGQDSGGGNSQLHLIIRESGGQGILMGFFGNDLQSNVYPPINQWSHVVFRYDASTGTREIYLDGNVIARGTTGTNYQGTGPILIGRWGGGNYFDGQIDEPAITPRALSPAEIAGMYRNGVKSHSQNDTATINEGGAASGNVLANDSTHIQQVMNAGSFSTGLGGSVTLGANGAYTYTSNPSTQSLALNETLVDSFLYNLANAGVDLANTRVVFNNHGPGGTLNAYLYDGTARPWDEARFRAANLQFGGVSGHLVSVNSAAENGFLRANFAGDFWVGLSDSTNYSGFDGVRNSIVDSGNSTTSTAWAWSNAEPYTFNSWPPSGEPNGGTGENVAQMRGDGFWNDLSTQSQPSVIEFNLGASNLVAPGFNFRQVRSTVTIDNNNNPLGQALNLLAGSNVLDQQSTHVRVINFAGSGDGAIGGGIAFPVAGDQSNFATETTGYVYIPAAGDWTFNVNSDDGFMLTFPGASLNAVSANHNGSILGADGQFIFNAGRGTVDTFGVFNFPNAGFYPIRLVHWEGGGGDSVELTAAQGAFTQASNASFRLVGDTDVGGLHVFTALPTLGESARVSITIVGENDAPVAGTVAAQTINEGSGVSFTMVGASDIDATDTITYEWDFNGDGTYDLTTPGNSASQTWAQLEAFGLDGRPGLLGTNNVNVRVRDNNNALSSVVTTTLTINNVDPVLTFDGPTQGPPGSSLTFDFSATDVSTADTTAGFTFDITWSDSLSPYNVTGVTSGSTSRTFAAAGTYTATVTVTDRDGGTDTTTHDVVISQVFVDGDGNAIINGSDGPDRIVLTNGAGGIVATINNRRQGAIVPDVGGKVIVYGMDGNDTITVSSSVSFPIEIHGGDGNDYLSGGVQADTIYGGDHNDRIFGGGGDDFLYGGNGNDSISGGAGADTIDGDLFLDADGNEDFGSGNDTLNGDAGNDIIRGGEGNDRINGGAAHDELYGEGGKDIMRGGSGRDLMLGGAGADLLYGDGDNDVVIGGDSADTLYGGSGNDLVLGDGLSEADAATLYMAWISSATSATAAAEQAFVSSSYEADDLPDNIYGQAGNDWLLAFLLDRFRDARSGDILDRDI